MRIVIEIEGDRVISATVEGSPSTGEPPPEILEAARARGAVSAGRAPLNLSAARAAAVPQDAGATRSGSRKGPVAKARRRRAGSREAGKTRPRR